MGRIVRGLRLSARLFLLAVSIPASGPSAMAQPRTDFLIERLRAEDPRVRAQAALSLGGTSDDAAVSPLCDALSDSSSVVRQSASAALRRLGRPKAIDCLTARASVEQSDAVRAQLFRTIRELEALEDGPSPFVPKARYYVSVAPVANGSNRAFDEVDRIIRSAARAKLDELGAYQLAPKQESPQEARAVMSKRKLKGYFLMPSLDRLDYSSGNLKVRVRLAVFGYPGKELRGEVPAGVAQTGVRPGDRAAEDNLIALATARAVELFSQSFP